MTASPPARIGLFGGSFDPPHLGHRALAETALRTLALDALRWLPAGRPWQKGDRALAAAEHRAAMVALAIAGEPRFVLDDRELRRSGASYTVDTVRELQAEQPGAVFFLVIGQDQYARLHTWRAWRELLAGVTLAVAAREGRVPAPESEVARTPHRLEVLPMPRVDVSATVIRRAAAQGADLHALVAPAVAGYIARHHLYRQDAAAR
jgi:nicotinate-nucleotide adenylyltransferase